MGSARHPRHPIPRSFSGGFRFFDPLEIFWRAIDSFGVNGYSTDRSFESSDKLTLSLLPSRLAAPPPYSRGCRFLASACPAPRPARAPRVPGTLVLARLETRSPPFPRGIPGLRSHHESASGTKKRRENTARRKIFRNRSLGLSREGPGRSGTWHRYPAIEAGPPLFYFSSRLAPARDRVSVVGSRPCRTTRSWPRWPSYSKRA